ncbi:hypothetical protein JR316_0007833 [Psilocybe cubensis]|uniref:Uncharacterized protein n=2 Tax=Psilocybe cubensis TaxID=181762 RepID=A0A8H7XSX5_PSICU|nr:hypothetical protein JR316_0007833 [Psilocybe cubensis]KAH9479245.1 hypothetical protein JR316_0007833 [Psilocybe cubensis]
MPARNHPHPQPSREVIAKNNDIQFSSTGWKTTHHGGNSTTGKASLSYTFFGSKVQIYGKINQDNRSVSPTLVCALDGQQFNSNNTNHATNDDDRLCEWHSDAQAGSHTVMLNFTDNGGDSLRFERILYRPDPTIPLNDVTIYVPHSDPAIRYEGDWKQVNGSHIATNGQANISFSFIGSSLQWFCDTPSTTNNSLNQSIQFSLDSSQTFRPVDRDSNDGDKSPRRSFFKIPDLGSGQHNITIFTKGFSNLTLSHLVLLNSEIQASTSGILSSPLPSSTSSDNTLPSSTPSETSDHKHKKQDHDHHSSQMSFKEKMVIGFVVGGLSLFFLALYTYLFCRRRRRRNRMNGCKCEEKNTGMPKVSKRGHQATTTLPAIFSHEYPFARQSPAQLRSNQRQVNASKKRLTVSSSSTAANTLFQVAPLSALPTKSEPDTPRTNRPNVARFFRFSRFSETSRWTTSSSLTLLPSPKRPFVALPDDDDQTVVMGYRPGTNRVVQSHSRPPEPLPPYPGR